VTTINIPAFSGLNILAAPQRIEDHQATVAVGCDFRSLDLRAFRSDRLTNLGATAFASSINASGASIYQLDDSYWIGALGDKSFCRSPTFFSDATTGQRLFVCDNAPANPSAAVEWDWVRDVDVDASDGGTDLVGTGNANSYFIGDTVKRLGVPKPGTIPKPTHTPRSGQVDSLERSTRADTKITLDADSATGLNKFDKINLFVPAIGDGPYPVADKTDAATPVFTLRNCRLVYVAAKVMAEADLVAKFVKANHGLFGGEQVVFNRTAATSPGFQGKLPALPVYHETLFQVNVIDDNTFYLTYLNAGAETEYKLTATATGDTLRYAVVAAQGDQIDDAELTASPSKVEVKRDPNFQYHQTVTYTPSDSVSSTWEIAADTLTDRSYVVTFVNPYGDESEPSAPTATFPVAQGDPVTFATLPVIAALYPDYTDPTGTYLLPGAPLIEFYRTPAKLRIYRTDAAGTYRLLTTEVDAERTLLWSEVANPDGSPKTINWVDTYPDTELGEPLATAGWQIPPKDLNGILISPGGSLVGYKDRSVVGSVPYAPYAFPISNRVAFDYPVVGLVGTSAGIVVVTQGMPALIVGDDPAAWSIQKLEYPYGCVSRRSIVDMGELAIYASADGLIGIAGANVEILTRDTIKREQWQDLYNPKAIIGAHAEGRYYGITEMDDGTRKAFMFDPRTRSFIDLTVGDPALGDPWPVAMYSRLDTDTLLILKSDGRVYEWNRGSDLIEYTWQSKWFQLPYPDFLGCGQILAPVENLANYRITMTLYGWDGQAPVEICQYTTNQNNVNPAARIYKFDKNINPFRLPVAPDRYSVFTTKLQGTLPVGQVSFASTISEIQQV
jgi:hypothetical protein